MNILDEIGTQLYRETLLFSALRLDAPESVIQCVLRLVVQSCGAKFDDNVAPISQFSWIYDAEAAAAVAIVLLQVPLPIYNNTVRVQVDAGVRHLKRGRNKTRYDEFTSGSGALFFELRSHERAGQKPPATLSHCYDLDFLDARGTFVKTQSS